VYGNLIGGKRSFCFLWCVRGGFELVIQKLCAFVLLQCFLFGAVIAEILRGSLAIVLDLPVVL